MLLMSPNGQLLVAVDPNQLRSMELETVDSIDWSRIVNGSLWTPSC